MKVGIKSMTCIAFAIILLGLSVASGQSLTASSPNGGEKAFHGTQPDSFIWVPVDSFSATSLINAGEKAVIMIDPVSGTITENLPDAILIDQAEDAVARAPDWMKLSLRQNFTSMNETAQLTAANLILNAEDPVVDEVAFQVAHLPFEVIEADSFIGGVLVENAVGMYSIDSLLPYASILDYGSALEGGDYYSTIEYFVGGGVDTAGYELPRDHYYWYVVMPRVTREFPSYIDPETGRVADPPDGVFWRDYFMNHADDGYPVLADSLAGEQTLWNQMVDNRDSNGAIGVIIRWVLDVMDFQTPPTRPLQPVKIYNYHQGTCSEHSYLTSAVSRAALIPCVSTIAYKDDHKWNEFWDRRWVSWEPVNTYTDSPHHYEGWGKEIAAAFNWRADGYIWTVTERYTEVCTLTINITDSLDRPVDGAFTRITSSGQVGWGCTGGWSSSNGELTYLVGDNRWISGRVYSVLGDCPQFGFVRITDNSMAGEHYRWDAMIEGDKIPIFKANPDSVGPDPSNEYRIDVEVDVPYEAVAGSNWEDDLHFWDFRESGIIDFFICDEEEYNLYTSGEAFRAFSIHPDTTSVNTNFVTPENGNWYVVLSNERKAANMEVCHLKLVLYRKEPVGMGDESPGPSLPRSLSLLQNYPNPFNPHTTIEFTLPDLENEAVELTVFDSRGRRVRTLVDDMLKPGKYSVAWDGRGESGKDHASGVYFYRLKVGNKTLVKKMLLLR
jgi:hypothetical protein